MSRDSPPNPPTSTPPESSDPGGALNVVIAGQPNAGKTTIFNDITGARQHVGNYPGVTVEKKEGVGTCDGRRLHVIDLPGTYSLTAHTAEEIVARNVIMDDAPDVVVDIVDASNLERNLYLATQLLELGVPLVLAFNMSDVAKAHGSLIDVEMLSDLLGVPIVETVGHKGTGVDLLLREAVRAASDPEAAVARQRRCHYGTEIEPHVEQLTARITAACGSDEHARWLAVKLFEDDPETVKRLRRLCPDSVDELRIEARRLGKHLQQVFGAPTEIILAERRYGFISGACSEAVRRSVESRHALSDRIDAVLTSRWMGLPIFAVLMYVVFYLVFTLGEPPMGWIEAGFNLAGEQISMLWPRGSDSILRSLLVDGIVGGVGGVIVFLPNILLLFLAIAFLEDTGYMARAAFIMDHLMHKLGLHGKSFIPMLIGFGCSVPAIMATRTLETRRDRLTTMLVVPLMSCGARFPIYALIIPAFFPAAWRAPMLWGIYLIGILLAIVSAKLLRRTVLRGEATPFVMELPPYRMPTLKGLLIHMWERGGMYLRKAGTIILLASILLWAISTFPRKQTFERDYDALAVEAQTQACRDADQLGPEAGLPAGSPSLGDVLRIEADLQAEQENYWEHEESSVRAVERADRATAALKAGPGGEALARFLAVSDTIALARAEFEIVVEEGEFEEGTSEYVAAELRRDKALLTVQRSDPRLHDAAVRFLDEVRVPLDERLTALSHERQGEGMAHSVAGRIGRTIEPALRPMGFDWRIGTALVGALAAKEVFVSQLSIIFSLGEADEGSEGLRKKLRQEYQSPLIGFCIILFTLVSAPCVATFAVTKRESNSWRWALLQFFGLTTMAYVLTVITYQVGRFLF